MRNTLKFPDMVASCTYHKTHRSIARFDNHSPVISYILPFVKSERPKASRLIASSLGHFLFYRPVSTVTGLITRSLLFYRPVSTVTGLILMKENFCFHLYYIHNHPILQYLKLLNFSKVKFK